MRRLFRAVVAAVCVAVPIAVEGQVLRVVKPSIPAGGGGGGGGTTIFADTFQNCGSGDTYGFDTETTDQEGIRWTKSCETAVGPGGQNAILFTSIAPSGSVPDGTAQGQHGLGWTNQVEANFGYNEPPRFMRYSIYVPSTGNTGECDRDGGDPAVSLGRCAMKWVVYGEGGPETSCRAIHELDVSDEGAGVKLRFRQQIDGGDEQGETGFTYNTDTWYHVIWEVKGNSALGVADGYYKMWIGAQGASKSYGSPDLDSGSIVLNVGGCQSGYWYTAYNNAEGLTTGNSFRIYLGRWQVVTEFDEDWFTW
jgi:hypothetical protein